MASPVTYQTAFRARDDSQALNTDTWTYSLNTNWSQAVDTIFRIRFQMEETNSRNFSLTGYIQYSLNGGGWARVTTTTPVQLALSAQYAHGDATSKLLTGSTRTFDAGAGYETGTPTSETINNECCENEYALTIDSAQVANGDTLQIRLEGIDAANYTYVPTITVIEITNVTPAESSQSQKVDAVVTKAVYPRTVGENAQAQVVDAAVLSVLLPSYNVTAVGGEQAQSADAPGLKVISPVTPAEAAQGQVSDAAAVKAVYRLTPAEAVQAQAADAPGASVTYTLTVGEGLQAQVSDAPSVSISGGAAVTPVTFVLDSFNRADENPLRADWWGSPFAADQGRWKIVDNQAVPVS